MIVRTAIEADLTAIRKLRPFLSVKEIFGRLNLQEGGSALLFVALEKDLLIGCVFLKFRGKTTHPEYPDMEDLFVDERFRGRGIGTALIAECEKRARELGYCKIGMAVNPDLNPKARAFYERLGYRHDGKSPYLDGAYDGVEDWVTDLEKEIL